MPIRTGIGFDAHRFARGRRLVLGGVEIPARRGLSGHSDADVVSHAVADALLGAVADGDIGRHFPDTDARWKDACSLDILRAVVKRLRAGHWKVLNVDAMVLAETPHIAPYAAQMRTNLAAALGVAVEQVSVKATTLEGMGAVGRGEGIMVVAVGTVMRSRKRNAARH